MNELKAKIIVEAFKNMDSFLVETNTPRSIDQLNQDRHLFMDQMSELFDRYAIEIVEASLPLEEKEELIFVKSYRRNYEWNECIKEMKRKAEELLK